MNKKLLSGSGLLLAAGLFMATNIIANGALTSWRMDVTDNKLYTLSKGTRNILANLTEPVTIKYYYSAKQFSEIPPLQSHGNRVRDMLEEYAAASKGKLKLSVIDPEPFSEAEDQAVADGIKQLPLGAGGQVGYLGVVGSNTTDEQAKIPLLQPNKEASLEYELTKLVYNLAHPKKRVIGVLSSLPIMGATSPEGQPSEGWTIGTVLQESFDLRNLPVESAEIPKEVDTLMVVHPKKLSDATRYAIDQFVLKGGKAMVFVDPLAESDRPARDPHNPMAMPETDSDLPDLLEKWGVKLVTNKIAGDMDAAIRVNYNGPRGPQEISYLPWLRLSKGHNINAKDFVTNELNVVNMASAGILEKVDAAGTELTPLLSTGKRAMGYERDAIMFNRDPGMMLTSFKSGDKSLLLAARISGKVKTAFPNGRPKKDPKDAADSAFIAESSNAINVVVVADTDLLADNFWVQVQNFLGMRVPSPIADNANFVVNALDNLGGNDDLISLRSRGEYSRPFTRVAAIQREAETEFRDKEQQLKKKLEETEAKIRDLQQKKEGGPALILSPEQEKAIDTFRDDQVRTRKELRAVQHDMNKNIESLGAWMKFLNIGLVPIGIALVAIGSWLMRSLRKPADWNT
jgi:ABC-type uncharacterized transport system involved in gliding motility auxiliary subunit